ncbi:hypothetical protein T4B_12595 [Trichinella pseudospiralis]|uniref:Uncharacterized protein n=1 Tax=Trichinella pseudospiralis TaxID=6337 RepID=A0A0V1G7V3_TRIPS|nr:hypothetical protein T4B_12595 [Trichinella pseudospiralis]
MITVQNYIQKTNILKNNDKLQRVINQYIAKE